MSLKLLPPTLTWGLSLKRKLYPSANWNFPSSNKLFLAVLIAYQVKSSHFAMVLCCVPSLYSVVTKLFESQQGFWIDIQPVLRKEYFIAWHLNYECSRTLLLILASSRPPSLLQNIPASCLAGTSTLINSTNPLHYKIYCVLEFFPIMTLYFDQHFPQNTGSVFLSTVNTPTFPHTHSSF